MQNSRLEGLPVEPGLGAELGGITHDPLECGGKKIPPLKITRACSAGSVPWCVGRPGRESSEREVNTSLEAQASRYYNCEEQSGNSSISSMLNGGRVFPPGNMDRRTV